MVHWRVFLCTSFSKDTLANRVCAIGLKAVVVFTLFFLSGFFISKLPSLSFFQSFESRTVKALLIVLPTFLAVILYALFSVCLIEKDTDEQKGFFNPTMRMIVSAVFIIVLLLFSPGIKSFMRRAFLEETANAVIFAIMASLVFTTLESLNKKRIESISYIIFSLPLSVLAMIFASKGVVALVRSNGGQLADILGNAFLWMIALLISILLSNLFDRLAKRVWTEKLTN